MMSREGRELFFGPGGPGEPCGLGLGSWQGSRLSFSIFPAPSASREAVVVAHTKRTGRVGAGDSSEQARGGNGAGCDSRRWPGLP